MFDKIIDLCQDSHYDFRVTANPQDPLRHLFEDWVPYYRMKWAIARELRPKRILEIGVRYGYSASTFLDACPEAEYLGIDNDSDLYGGVPGALGWAQETLRDHKAEFLKADSQRLERLPGHDFYDLVHIDGQQDGNGYLHDLEMSLNQSQYILADGYFLTRENFLAASEFLYRNRRCLAYYGVIPGYAGELLIKTRTSSQAPRRKIQSSSQIRDTYTAEYYLEDCAGYDSFKATLGATLTDNRLRTVAEIAGLAPRGRALDIGCGRGEVSLAMARQGFAVTAIDYSADAIKLARGAFAATGDPSLSIEFHCGDANQVPLEGVYDSVVASDVVEHLTPGELDQLYARVARHLSSGGLFVVHTFPNSWFYRYEYGRKLRAARALGAYLPQEPRSRYEKLMHINEQSPRTLRKQLAAQFPHVLLWFASNGLNDPVEYLERKPRLSAMRGSTDLFAVASFTPMPASTIATVLRMHAAPESEAQRIKVEVSQYPCAVTRGESFAVEVRITNASSTALRSYPPFPVYVSYHWLHSSTAGYVVFEGERSVLYPGVQIGAEAKHRAFVRAPTQAGEYRLRMTLVQEHVRWLDQAPFPVFDDVRLAVT